MNCTKCGKELNGEVKFCDGCGTPVGQKQEGTQTTVVNEGSENKVIFILAYLGILFFLPLVSCPNSKAGKFHANQGLILLITSIAGQIAVTILSSVLIAISWGLWVVSSLLYWVWAIAILVLAIIGMINANKGEQKPLPVIGKFKIIK